MPKKAKKTVKKSEVEETAQEHEKKHSPDVKRLLEEYEDKDVAEDDDFTHSEQFDMNKEEGEF